MGRSASRGDRMKALSIWQPWAWAIIHAHKNVENRGWRTNYRGPLLIHASRRKPSLFDMEALDFIYAGGPDPNTLPLGGIVGQVDLVDCVRNHSSPWAAPGQWHWVLARPRPLPFRAVRGAQGLFEVHLDELEPGAPATRARSSSESPRTPHPRACAVPKLQMELKL